MSKKSQLKKKGYTDSEINTYLLSHGYFKEKKEEPLPSSPEVIQQKVSVMVSTNVKLTEALVEQAIVKRLSSDHVSSSDIMQAISFLDKKKALTRPPRPLLPPTLGDLDGISS